MTFVESSASAEAVDRAVKAVMTCALPAPAPLPEARPEWLQLWRLVVSLCEQTVLDACGEIRWQLKHGAELGRESRMQLHAKATELGDHWLAGQVSDVIALSKRPVEERVRRCHDDYDDTFPETPQQWPEFPEDPEDMRLCGKIPRKRRERDRQRRACSSYE